MSRPTRAGKVGRATPTPRRDGELALKFFDRVLGGPSWAAWRAWLCAVFGLLMSEAEADVFRRCTGRTALPTQPAREVWNIVARRAGKSRVAGLLAAFFAGVKRWTLAPGETGIVQIVTPSRRQATVILDYAEAFLGMLPGVEIVRRTVDTIEVSTGITIAVQTASFRTPRGFSVVACLLDEVAFFRSDDGAANVDTEILRAIRPALASTPGSLLIALSSPYSQHGELFRTYERHFGRDGSDTLVWQADTRTMNPTIPQGLIDQAMEDDASSAAAEWMGVFRADLERLFGREQLEAVTVAGRFELAPQPGVAYVAFLDPSGGSADSFTLGIAHRDSQARPVLDLVREVKPPFSPEAVCQQFAADIKRYGCTSVYADNYAAEWPREQFRKLGIVVEPSPLSRSELFLELLPLVNSGGIELLDHPRLIAQLTGLERRVGRSGRDSVDHQRGSHDDVANAAAGALVFALRSTGLATLPEGSGRDYCNRVLSNMTGNGVCFLFSGAWIPPQDAICRSCEGNQAVRSARHRHQERTGESVNLIEFFRSTFALSDRVAYRQAVRIGEETLGL